MSNATSNREQDQVIDLTLTQQNPGAAKASDFIIEDRDGGQHGDSKAERAALLAEADDDAKTSLRASAGSQRSASACREHLGRLVRTKPERRKLHRSINGLTNDQVAAIVRQSFPRV